MRDASPDALIIVDGISGLGAVPFETDGWGLDVVATGSQKSWMVPPGLAMMSRLGARLGRGQSRPTMPRFYFDLAQAAKYARQGRDAVDARGRRCRSRWTSRSSMIEAEGYPRIFARHAACGAAARAGLQALGFEPFAEPEHASKTVTAAWLPEGVDWATLNRRCAAEPRRRRRSGPMSGRILRLGHLGAVTHDDIVRAIEIIEESALAIGMPVEAGAGPRAARAVSAEAVPTLA